MTAGIPPILELKSPPPIMGITITWARLHRINPRKFPLPLSYLARVETTKRHKSAER